MSLEARILRIFVVDESETYRTVIERTLKGKFTNIQIEMAENGEQALNMALKPPDLIVTGLGLPVCDGFTMIERLRANPHTRQVPVLVVSQRDTPEAMTRLTRMGIQGFLVKPFIIEDLVINVEAILRRQIGRDAVDVLPRNAVRRPIEGNAAILYPVHALTQNGICAVLGNYVEPGASFPADLQEIRRYFRISDPGEPAFCAQCLAQERSATCRETMVVKPFDGAGDWQTFVQSIIHDGQAATVEFSAEANVRLRVPARALDLSASGMRVISPLAAETGEILLLSLAELPSCQGATRAESEVMGRVMRSSVASGGFDLGLQFEAADPRLINNILQWSTAE